jgi:serine/threonine protein kinase
MNNTKALLNFNTIYKKSLNKKHKSLDTLTNDIGKLFKHAYEFTKFVGRGIQGDIYVVKNTNTNTDYICKIIDNVDETTKLQIENEIKRLQNLSTNLNSKSYVIPCIDYIFHKNTAYLIFPIKTGYKIKNIYPILKSIKERNERLYNAVVMYIYRQIIKAVSVIHNKRVAHQNLDTSSIHISTDIKKIKDFTDIGKLEVRLVDFGLSCSGNGKESSCLKEPTYFLNNSSNKSNTKRIMAATKIAKTMKTMKPDAELIMAQRYDIWCCGKILYELLHNGELDVSNYINDQLDNDKAWYNDFKINKTHNVSITGKLLRYNEFIEKYMLVPILKRKSANYILNKLLISEKY